MDDLPVIAGLKHGQNPEVVVFAAEEARRRGAPLRIVHACERHGVGHGLFDDVRSSVLTDRRYAAVPVECVEINGATVDVLLKESGAASCLVIGTDDVAWTARAAGAGIARQVAQCADSPVVVVPRATHPGRSATGVVVALDEAVAMDGLLAYAFDAARSRREPLEVIHAAGIVSDYPEREDHHYKLDEAVDGWRDRFPDVTVRTAVEPGSPVATCLAAAAGASLLVVGQPSVPRVRVGSRSVVARLVRRSGVPMAVVPVGHRLDGPAS